MPAAALGTAAASLDAVERRNLSVIDRAVDRWSSDLGRLRPYEGLCRSLALDHMAAYADLLRARAA